MCCCILDRSWIKQKLHLCEESVGCINWWNGSRRPAVHGKWTSHGGAFVHSNTTEFFSPYPSSSSKSIEAPALRNPPPRPRDLRHCRFRGRVFLVWPNDGWRAANERKKRTSLICWMREKESEKLSEDSQPQHEILSAAKVCGFSLFQVHKNSLICGWQREIGQGREATWSCS